MEQAKAIIERVRRVSDTHQRLALAVEPNLLNIKPGQTLLVRQHDAWNPYLRETWHPVTIEGNLLLVERPGELHYAPGSVIDIIGPVGGPFRFRKLLRSVLMLAHNAPPTPLLFSLVPLLANKIGVTLVLLGSARAYATGHLPPEVEILRGEGDGLAWPNRVTTIGWADQVLAVTNPDAEADGFTTLWRLFAELRAEIPAHYLFAVHAGVQPCGVGACGACMVRMQGGAVAACTEGPALDMSKMVFNR